MNPLITLQHPTLLNSPARTADLAIADWTLASGGSTAAASASFSPGFSFTRPSSGVRAVRRAATASSVSCWEHGGINE